MSDEQDSKAQAGSGEGGSSFRVRRKPAPTEVDDAFQAAVKEAGREAGRHKWLSLAGVVAVVAVVGGVVAWRQQSADAAAQTTRDLRPLTDLARAIVTPQEVPKDARLPAPVFATEDARDEAVAKALAAVPAGDAATLAALVKGQEALAAGDFDAALAAYKGFLAAEPSTHALRFLAQEGVVHALQGLAKHDEAIAAAIELEGTKGAFFRDRAMYLHGRSLEAKGDKDGAIAIYKQYVEEYPLGDPSLAQRDVRARVQALAPELLEAADKGDKPAIEIVDGAAAPAAQIEQPAGEQTSGS